MPPSNSRRRSDRFGVNADSVEHHKHIPLDVWERLPEKYKKELMDMGWIAGVPPEEHKIQ
jgi:hypothetical protein